VAAATNDKKRFQRLYSVGGFDAAGEEKGREGCKCETPRERAARDDFEHVTSPNKLFAAHMPEATVWSATREIATRLHSAELYGRGPVTVLVLRKVLFIDFGKPD
jgi:hypothetical protein